MKSINLIDENKIYGNKLDFDLFNIRKYPPSKLKETKDKKIHALDTETLKGYCKLLADDTGEYLLDGELDDILFFLCKKKFENTYNFFYNLNYDINAIIKFLPKNNLIELKEDNKTQYNQYKIFFIPRKIFSISKGKHTFSYYDVAQFFNGSLDKNAQKYLALNKYQKEYKNIDGEKLGKSKKYWDKHLPIIIEYCINDCKLTKRIAELLHNTVKEAIKINPRKYMSKASLTKDYIKKEVNIPHIQKIPKPILAYAFNTYKGGRFEIVEKGNIGKCTMYDIKSAYPYHMKNLIDINNGEWKKVNSLNENAYYGYYLVHIYSKYNKISPLTYYAKNGTLIYPVMAITKYMTKNELLAYEKYIEYDIIDGWEFYPNKIIHIRH